MLGVQIASSYAIINDLVLELPDGGEENQTEENIDSEIEFESDKLMNDLDALSEHKINNFSGHGANFLHSSSYLEILIPPPDFS